MSHSCQCDTPMYWHKILRSARTDGSTTRWPSVHNKMAAVLRSGWLQINWWKLYFLYDNHLHFCDNIRVVIVEVRLFGVKLVQVELFSVLVPCPGGAPKHALLSDKQVFFNALKISVLWRQSRPAAILIAVFFFCTLSLCVIPGLWNFMCRYFRLHRVCEREEFGSRVITQRKEYSVHSNTKVWYHIPFLPFWGVPSPFCV